LCCIPGEFSNESVGDFVQGSHFFFLQKRSLGVKKLENDWDRSRSWRERSRATWASCHKRCQRNGRWFRRSQQFATPAVWRRSRFVDISCGL